MHALKKCWIAAALCATLGPPRPNCWSGKPQVSPGRWRRG